MQQDISRTDRFTALVRELVPLGWSGNAIIDASRQLGIGIQRSAALDAIRDVRTDLIAQQERVGTIGELAGTPAEVDLRWGELVQATDQWLRFDGPNAIMFQQGGPNSDEWLDYVITPEDEDFIAQRLVIEDEEYVDPDRPGSGYRTTQPLPADISAADAARRIGVDPGRVARVIYDRP